MNTYDYTIETYVFHPALQARLKSVSAAHLEGALFGDPFGHS